MLREAEMLQVVARQGVPTLFFFFKSSDVIVKIEKQEAVQHFWNKFSHPPPETSNYLLPFLMLSLLFSLSGIW